MKSLTKRGWILAGSALSTLVAGVFEKRTLLQLGFAVLFGSTAHAGRNQSHVLIRLIFTCRAARISLLGDPIS
jgi:hypothetical protein